VFASNTEATRAFVPHIDAVIVVLGADQPISGAELDLIDEVAKRIDRVVLVLNKSDRLTDAERIEGRAFAEQVVRGRLKRDVGPIFEVSALERATVGPTRDWTKLDQTLVSFGEKSHEVVRDAERRGVARLAGELQREIDEQRGALVRPREQSEKRIEALRQGVERADTTLRDLEYLFVSVQDGLARTFDGERRAFLGRALPSAIAELERFVDEIGDMRHAATKANAQAEQLDRFRSERAPAAEALYRRAVTRFVEVAREILAAIVVASDDATAGSLASAFDPDTGFRAKPHFYFTDLMTIAGPKLTARLGSVAAIKTSATEYMTRLFETNSARVVNDFSEQVLESRRRVQGEMRDYLKATVSSAQAALERALAQHALGESSVHTALGKLEQLTNELGRSSSHD
jgi:hypothetical protein